MIAQGDEMLDWREMATRCAGAHIEPLSGDDDAPSNSDELLPTLIRFLNLCD